MSIEPWDESADQTDWQYVRDHTASIEDRNGRPVYTFRFDGQESH